MTILEYFGGDFYFFYLDHLCFMFQQMQKIARNCCCKLYVYSYFVGAMPKTKEKTEKNTFLFFKEQFFSNSEKYHVENSLFVQIHTMKVTMFWRCSSLCLWTYIYIYIYIGIYIMHTYTLNVHTYVCISVLYIFIPT